MSEFDKEPKYPVTPGDEDKREDDSSEKKEYANEPVEDIHSSDYDSEKEPNYDSFVSTEPTVVNPAPAKATSTVLPWVVAVLAIAALVFVLIRNGEGNSTLNEAVGKLDNKNITKAEFYDEMVDQVGKQQAGSMLDSYMILKLITNRADKLGVKVTDADITKEVDRIKAKNNFTNDEEFDAALSSSGTTLDKFREQLKTQVELRGIFGKEQAPKEEDLKAYFDKNKANYGEKEKVKASHILLKTKPEAEAVLKELQGGADFATVAKEKSIDPGSKDKGGDLDYFVKGVMNEPFETAAFSLKVGELSGVVESPNGFHIIKVVDHKQAETPTYDQVKDEVRNDYLDEKINEGATDWLTKAKKEANYVNLITNPANPSASPSASPAASAEASPSPSEKTAQ